ncbi:DUF2759 family protein [Microbulbifer sp. ANSA003]
MSNGPRSHPGFGSKAIALFGWFSFMTLSSR